MRSVFKIIIIFFFLFYAKKVSAQETMLTEISNSYLDTLIMLAKENYPKVKVFNNRIDIAKNNVSKSKVSYLDAVNASYLYNPTSTFNVINPSFFNGFQFGINLNLGILLEKPFQIKNARKDLTISKLEKDEYELELEALVKERYYIYVQKQTLLKSRLQATQDQENIVKATKYKFERGEVTIENYNTILVGYATQNQLKIEVESELLIAKARLEEIIGIKLNQIK